MADVMMPDAQIDYYSQGLRERFRIDALKLQPPAIDKDEKYADIDYQIDEAKYMARSKAIVRAGGLETKVPAGFPKTLEGPLVWKGTDFQDEDEYVIRLEESDKAELQQALDYFKGIL